MSLSDRLPLGWTCGKDSFGDFASHAEAGPKFRLLREGTYRIGMSSRELEAARRLTPLPNITVAEVTPVTEVHLTDVLVGDRPVSVQTAGRNGIAVDGEDAHPAMLSRADAVELAVRLGCRLPSEAEWETCCRAGSASLFVWGDALPPAEELEPWFSWEIDGPDIRRNEMGVGGLFFGEWCDEVFRVSHAPDAEVVPGAHVVKGGGAQFWPWQDEEWVWCTSAMRMPSTALFADQRCAARLVLSLP